MKNPIHAPWPDGPVGTGVTENGSAECAPGEETPLAPRPAAPPNEAETAWAQAREWRRKAELLEDEVVRLSAWAARVHAAPVRYAIKRTAYEWARRFLHLLPLSPSARADVRRWGLSATRLLRASGRESAGPSPRPAAGTPPALPPPAGRDIFIFSVIDWHYRIQRPQHLARGFARRGHRVFFFSNHFLDRPDPGYALECVDPAGPVFQVRLHLSGAPAIYVTPPGAPLLAQLKAGLGRFLLDAQSAFSLAIVQHPFWHALTRDLGLARLERDALRQSDLVVVTSSSLERRARPLARNLALVPNAADFAHFRTPPSRVLPVPEGRTILGYVGAIADWFDVDLVRAVAEADPRRLVVLVGKDTAGARKALGKVPNIVFVGEAPYDQLPFYLHAFDVCLVPFRRTPLTEATNPVKVYEYLAAGKPVVSVDLPELARFGDLVRRSGSREGFLEEVSRAVAAAERRPAVVERRRRFAAAQTWDHRVEEIHLNWRRLRFPTISVIVLTHNQRSLTEACLQSLREDADGMDLEIVAVDNASTDDTPAFLTEFARGRPEVKVLLQEKNLGFAAGNNRGLAAATGDFLVLLNNDTVVTRGWAATLRRHLEDDPSAGLIGPVTNNIGNEARVETVYRHLKDMPDEARRVTLGRMGKVFPLRTLGFFCVMMPRRTYEKVGPLCEDFGLGFFEDDDYCRRVEKAGWRILCAEDVFVHHHLSASFNQIAEADRQALFERNRTLYEKKWGTWVPHAYRSGTT